MTNQANTPRTPKFTLGQIVATPGALNLLARSATTSLELLARHVCGDWGDLDGDDAREYDSSLVHGSRLLSAYKVTTKPPGDPTGAPLVEKLWIITEWDRSVTTLLLPEEY